MKLKGLTIHREVKVLNEEVFGATTYHELEDGTKCIKVHQTKDENSPVVKEFKIGNKTKKVVLWNKCNEWKKRVHHVFNEYIAPDGKIGPYSYFLREVEKGNLHGTIVSV